MTCGLRGIRAKGEYSMRCRAAVIGGRRLLDSAGVAEWQRAVESGVLYGLSIAAAGVTPDDADTARLDSRHYQHITAIAHNYTVRRPRLPCARIECHMAAPAPSTCDGLTPHRLARPYSASGKGRKHESDTNIHPAKRCVNIWIELI